MADRPTHTPPEYDRWHQDSHTIVAWRPTVDAVRAAIDQSGSLCEWATNRSRQRIDTGRGSVYRVRLGEHDAAVRHFRRGGWMAPLLGDRYLDSPPRPFLELAVSDRLRRAGVTTPRVLCAVVTPARPGYRADLATEWLEPGHDLEALLAPNRYPVDVRIAAMRAAGALVGRAHRCGLDHADLNIGNVFVQPLPEGQWQAALLDLDRARIAEPDGQRATANLERFQRSLEKVRRAGRVSWSSVELDAFRQAYDEMSGT